MFFVQQRNRRAQIEPLRKTGIDAAHAVQRFTVTDQNPQRALRGRGRDFDRDTPHDALATIRTQHGFYDNLAAGPRFSHIRAGGFQVCGATVGDDVKFQIHALDLGARERIIENAVKAIAQQQRRAQGSR